MIAAILIMCEMNANRLPKRRKMSTAARATMDRPGNIHIPDDEEVKMIEKQVLSEYVNAANQKNPKKFFN